MKKAREMVAWVCVFSILLMGCYSSALVEPAGDEKEDIYSGNIEYVVTKDGLKHVFDVPPTIRDSAIVGMSNHKAVSIPLAEVSRVYVTTLNIEDTIGVVVGIVLFAGLVGVLLVIESI